MKNEYNDLAFNVDEFGTQVTRNARGQRQWFDSEAKALLGLGICGVVACAGLLLYPAAGLVYPAVCFVAFIVACCLRAREYKRFKLILCLACFLILGVSVYLTFFLQAAGPAMDPEMINPGGMMAPFRSGVAIGVG